MRIFDIRKDLKPGMKLANHPFGIKIHRNHVDSSKIIFTGGKTFGEKNVIELIEKVGEDYKGDPIWKCLLNETEVVEAEGLEWCVMEHRWKLHKLKHEKKELLEQLERLEIMIERQEARNPLHPLFLKENK